MIAFIEPDPEELALTRADPLLWEHELDVRPAVAASLEAALGLRAGRAYWRSAHDHLYAIELADTGQGRPSSATVFGHWDRWEPRPPDHEIDADLGAFLAWFAGIADGLDPADFTAVASRAGIDVAGGWPAGSVLPAPPEALAPRPEFPYEPRFVEVEPGLRMAWVEAGDPHGQPILCLHGNPTWGYLYRSMIPAFVPLGRVIVPDLIGLGRSDKPVAANAHTYRSHARWLRRFVELLGLRAVTLVAQDWGGLLGLRVVADQPERFDRLALFHTGLPRGEDPGATFRRWRPRSQRKPIDVAELLAGSVNRGLSPAELAAYAAPFPTASHATAVNRFPLLVPTRPDHPGAYENRVAAARLATLSDRPVLLAAGRDPLTEPWQAAIAPLFPQAETVVIDAEGHFLQEEAGPQLAALIAEWIQRTSPPAEVATSRVGDRFEQALAYAASAHRHQLRKGTTIPYAGHLLAVCSLVLEDGGDEDEAIAALLHDAVEDQGGAERLADIAARFGSRVAGIVEECSGELKDGRPWRARKEAYLAHLAVASASALRVSLADKLHNARSLVADLRVHGPATWDRFNAGRDEQLWYVRSLLAAYQRRTRGPLLDEYARVVADLEALSRPDPDRPARP